MQNSRLLSTDLVLFGAGHQLLALAVQLGEAARDALHACVQHPVLVILSVEVVLVVLPLVQGQQWHVLAAKQTHTNIYTSLKT